MFAKNICQRDNFVKEDLYDGEYDEKKYYHFSENDYNFESTNITYISSTDHGEIHNYYLKHYPQNYD